MKWSCDVQNKTASNIFALEGRNTPDTSSLCEFDFYEPVWNFELNAFPVDKRVMEQRLGEAHKIGQAICYWVMTSMGKPIARSTVQAKFEADLGTDLAKAELKALDEKISIKLSSVSN
jgi:hypothetical protein